SAIFRAVEEAGLWLGFDRFGRSGSSKPVRVASIDALLDTLPGWEPNDYMVGPDPGGDRGGSFLEIVVRKVLMRPSLIVTGEDLERLRGTLLDAMEQVLVGWCVALRGRAVLSPVGGAIPFPQHEPKSRPPLEQPAWGTSR